MSAAAAFSQTPGGGRLPKVLVIGDSISIGYTEPLKKILAGKYEISHNPENGGPTSNGIAHIDEWLAAGHWDVITFNFGLHDLKLDTGPHQVEIPQYQANLKTILAALHKTGAKLIWVTTTPVPTGHLNPKRERPDVPLYNDAAAHVIKGQVDAVCDLYTAVLPRESEMQQKENVHFTPEGYEFLAGQVAAAIQSQLPR
jgi:acyl-CoA thioesterase-1